MAVKQELAARLSFLQDAAHLLSTTAPTTSSYLAGSQTFLLSEQDMPLGDARRQHICTCCGHIMVPGQDETTLRFESASRQRVQRQHVPVKVAKRGAPAIKAAGTRAALRSPTQPPTKLLTCGNCGKYTKIEVTGPKPPRRQRLAMKGTAMSDASKVGAGTIREEVRPTGNASSKKRAKSRKAGLQALLDQSRPKDTASHGLTLSSFLKK